MAAPQAPIDIEPPEWVVEIQLFAKDKGGRQSPILPPYFTCPLILDDELFTCRMYVDGPVEPGETVRAKLRLVLPELVVDRLVPGAAFQLWELGPIASGLVLSVN